MKKICIIIKFVILLFIVGSEFSMACHEESMGGDGGIWPTLRGHNPSSRANGLLVFTESTTAATSTTTSCDEYTSFLDNSYYQIAENVVRGEGIFLDALVSYYGCPIERKNRLENLFRENYTELFNSQEKNGKALDSRLVLVLRSDKRLMNECILLSKLS